MLRSESLAESDSVSQSAATSIRSAFNSVGEEWKEEEEEDDAEFDFAVLVDAVKLADGKNRRQCSDLTNSSYRLDEWNTESKSEIELALVSASRFAASNDAGVGVGVIDVVVAVSVTVVLDVCSSSRLFAFRLHCLNNLARFVAQVIFIFSLNCCTNVR